MFVLRVVQSLLKQFKIQTMKNFTALFLIFSLCICSLWGQQQTPKFNFSNLKFESKSSEKLQSIKSIFIQNRQVDLNQHISNLNTTKLEVTKTTASDIAKNAAVYLEMRADLTASSSYVGVNCPFEINLGFANKGSSDFNGSIIVLAFEEDTEEFAGIVGIEEDIELPSNYQYSSFTINSFGLDVDWGDYILQAFYQEAGDSDAISGVIYPTDEFTNYEIVDVTSSSCSRLTAYSQVTVNPDPILQNCPFEVSMDILNIGNSRYDGTIFAILMDINTGEPLELIEQIDNYSHEGLSSEGYYWSTVTFTSEGTSLPSGDYFATIAYIPEGEETPVLLDNMLDFESFTTTTVSNETCDEEDNIPCENNEFTLSLTLDDYGAETTWEILNGNNVIFQGGAYENNTVGTVITESICLPDGCYDFVIYDTYGDGICCTYGEGNYSFTDTNGIILASGGEFGTEDRTSFCVELEEEDFLTVDQNIFEVDATANTISVSIESNVDWIASTPMDWVTISPNNGTGNGTISIDFEENLMSTQRNVAIEIKTENENVFQTIYIEQSGAAAFLELASNLFTVSEEENSLYLEVESNIDWELDLNQVDWISSPIQTYTGSQSFYINVQKNITSQPRTAQLLLKALDGSISKTITIQQAEATIFEVDTDYLYAEHTESNLTFTISSNTSWNIGSPESWLSFSSVSGEGNAVIEVMLTENENLIDRTTSIYIDADGAAYHEIQITQEAFISEEPVIAPQANFEASETVIGVGQMVDFYDLSSNDPTSWEWTFVGADQESFNVQNPTGITYSQPGEYTVFLTCLNEGGYDNEIKTSYITVIAKPVADFEVNINEVLVGESVNFADISSNNPTSWEWIISNGSTEIEVFTQSPTVIFEKAGTYTVSLKVENIAGSDTELKINLIEVSETVGVHEANLLEEVNVFPNPATDWLTINISDKINVSSTIRLMDSTGRLVYNTEANNWNTTQNIDIRDLQTGMYVLHIITEEGKYYTEQIIISR